ncbi:MAG: tetratricopeptide repeat protein [Planctomycetia bacterium]|nr:MAG: tetratricopeptide repeat protein [Planctomycetia bacterium]HQU30883.1 tetratricopeptide repeat protein [Candidatus Brocadia sapporoensis]
MIYRKGKIYKFGYFMTPFLIVTSLGWIDPMADKVREGNQLYHKGAYEEALDKYVDAQVHAPQVSQLDFNIADTQYQRKKYDEAARLFEKIVQTDDPEMQAKASFNMGNTLYRQGKMKEAMECYKKAVDFTDELEYKGDEAMNSLKNDARYNYEYVERKMKEDERKQQEQNQKENEQKQEQDTRDKKEDQHQKEDKDEEKEKNEPQDDKQESGQKNTQKNDDDAREDKQDQSDKDKEKEKDQHAKRPQPMQPQGQRQMSKEEAERFLDALNHAEKETRQMLKDNQRLQHKSVEKDW